MGGLVESVTESDLRTYFAMFGAVEDVSLRNGLNDKVGLKNGFVVFRDEKSANAALHYPIGHLLHDHAFRCELFMKGKGGEWLRPQNQKSDRSESKDKDIARNEPANTKKSQGDSDFEKESPNEKYLRIKLTSKEKKMIFGYEREYNKDPEEVGYVSKKRAAREKKKRAAEEQKLVQNPQNHQNQQNQQNGNQRRRTRQRHEELVRTNRDRENRGRKRSTRRYNNNFIGFDDFSWRVRDTISKLHFSLVKMLRNQSLIQYTHEEFSLMLFSMQEFRLMRLCSSPVDFYEGEMPLESQLVYLDGQEFFEDWRMGYQMQPRNHYSRRNRANHDDREDADANSGESLEEWWADIEKNHL